MPPTNKPKVVALQIGREKSVGFPGKNVYPVLGRSLMEYPLIAARNSKYIDEIFVSTDSPTIAAVAKKYEAIIVDRPPELGTHTARGQDVYVDVYQRFIKSKNVDVIVILGCNAPTVVAPLLDQSVEALMERSELDSAVSVSQYDIWNPIRAKKISPDGILVPFIPLEVFDPKILNSSDRSISGGAFFADASFFSIKPRCLENMELGIPPYRWMGKKSYPIHNWAGCDVDYPWQIPIVEHWLREHGYTELKTPYDR